MFHEGDRVPLRPERRRERFYGIDGKLGYAHSGEFERERLLRVAEDVYRELDH